MRTFNKLTICAFSALCLFGVTLSLSGRNSAQFKLSNAGDETYHTVWDSSDVISALSDDYAQNTVGTVSTDFGNSLTLNFIAAKKSSGNFVQLAPGGMIHNFSSGDTPIHGISAVKATFSGTLSYSAARASDGTKALLQKPISLTSGTKVTVPSADYFKFYAADGGATIESLELFYGCVTDALDVKLLDGTYTGVGNDSYTYQIDANNGSATFKSLDKPSNVNYNGTVELLSSSQARFSFNSGSDTLTVNVDAYKHSLTYASKTGSSLPQVSLARVYDLEDFESFSATGDGFTSTRGAASVYSMSGLRRAVYADYYGNNSVASPIGGSGWSMMGSTDFLQYYGTKGHNSSKVAILKGNSNSLRYIFGFNSLVGVPEVYGLGTKLSFWARGAYSNAACTTNSSVNAQIKVYAWKISTITPSTQSGASNRVETTITIPAGSDWTEYTLDLSNGTPYYAFGFYLNTSATVYLPVDDIKIYTTSPYAEYTAPVAVTGVSVSPTALNLEPGNNSTLTATVTPNDATNKGVSWSSNNTSVATVDSSGKVTAVAAGNATITVTTDDGGYTATCAVTVAAAASSYPKGSYKGTAVVSGSNFDIVLAFGTRSNGLIGVRLSNSDAVATGITYNDSTNAFTITTTGSYSGYSFGNITGTYDAANDRITGVACSGQVSAAVSNNGSITCTRLEVWDCDGTTSELQSLFKRRYMSGSWQVDNSNADRITSNTTEFVSGTGSVKRRGYSGGAVALNFNSDFATAKTVKNVQFWVYNPSASDITLRMWGYKATGFGSNFETGSVTAKAGQWTYVAMGFTQAAVYNWQIADFNNTGVYLSFDNIALF